MLSGASSDAPISQGNDGDEPVDGCVDGKHVGYKVDGVCVDTTMEIKERYVDYWR